MYMILYSSLRWYFWSDSGDSTTWDGCLQNFTFLFTLQVSLSRTVVNKLSIFSRLLSDHELHWSRFFLKYTSVFIVVYLSLTAQQALAWHKCIHLTNQSGNCRTLQRILTPMKVMQVQVRGDMLLRTEGVEEKWQDAYIDEENIFLTVSESKPQIYTFASSNGEIENVIAGQFATASENMVAKEISAIVAGILHSIRQYGYQYRCTRDASVIHDAVEQLLPNHYAGNRLERLMTGTYFLFPLCWCSRQSFEERYLHQLFHGPSCCFPLPYIAPNQRHSTHLCKNGKSGESAYPWPHCKT